MLEIYSNLVDLEARTIFPACIHVDKGKIVSITKCETKNDSYILPGFVDGHVHVESSMVTPYEFSREALRHGTVGTVSDPHEIANVLGLEGVQFMVNSARKSPMKFSFGAPSCVPATNFETSGAYLGPSEIEKIFEIPEVCSLSEVMNFPGVINDDIDLLKKISLAKKKGYPVDGHAPALSGSELRKYAAAGISTDHESFTYEEGKEKIESGMKILIREGSAARNFDSLIPLLNEYPDDIMFCSDDLHPDDLIKGHINLLVRRAISDGYNLFDVLRASSYNVIKHYNLNIGLLQENDPADFIMVNNLEDFNIISTYIDGEIVYDGEEVELNPIVEKSANIFNAKHINFEELVIPYKSDYVNVIEVLEGELVTRKLLFKIKERTDYVMADMENDILKIAVQNRYHEAKPALGLIKGFNIKKGAIASSIAHDSHNIVCVGTDDHFMMEAMNWIVDHKGGIAFHDGNHIHGLGLEVAGIMTRGKVRDVATTYANITKLTQQHGSTLKAPFMTLAFMSLLVIPEIKLSDKGLFDGNIFEFISLYG